MKKTLRDTLLTPEIVHKTVLFSVNYLFHCFRLMDKPLGQKDGILYTEYLQLNKILCAQRLMSREKNSRPSHDEHLFIVVHQGKSIWISWNTFSVNIHSVWKLCPLLCTARAIHRLRVFAFEEITSCGAVWMCFALRKSLVYHQGAL